MAVPLPIVQREQLETFLKKDILRMKGHTVIASIAGILKGPVHIMYIYRYSREFWVHAVSENEK